MTEPARFLCRQLASAEVQGLRVLDAVAWPGPFGRNFRLYLGRGAHPAALAAPEGQAGAIQRVAKVAGNLVATGSVAEGAGLALALAGGPVTLDCAAPEPGLFRDANVLLALRHHETPEQVADWLRFHVDRHGATGLLLFDRAGEAEFADELQGLVADIEALDRVVVVASALPLGAPGQPALGDPATAPRAKVRDFTPDPWRAPLNEPVLYDILRWRFLAQASVVMALDPCDLLRDGPDGIGAFETCRQSHTGLVPLRGQAIYPWRIRKGQAPHPGDHVFRTEPAQTAPARWAVAPKRAEPGACWLPGKIPGMGALADEVLDYDRAMSILAPGAEIATLINKDHLVPAPDLLARAQDVFDHSPILPPKRAPAKAAPLVPAPSGRVLAVTCMKNEGPFILEWLAYHRMIGIDDFLIYTNDCDDGTDTMLDALQARGMVQRRDNPFRETSGKPQQSALAAAWDEPLVRQAGWIVSMDVDEFLNVHVGKGRLQDLFAAVPDANMISATWRLFGNSDIAAYEDRPVTAQFTRCAPHLIRRPHQAWGFKTLFRNIGLWQGIGVHRPRGALGGPVNWVNGSGKPMPERMIKTGWRSALDSYGYDLVTLNHYAVRSAESFLVKRDRGRVNHVARDQGEAYWFRMNNNAEQDLSIQRHAGALDSAITELKSDPEIAALHDASVAVHRAKIASLRADPEYGALYDRITGERLQRLSRLHRHLGMNVFLHGPSVVPDRLLDPDLPRDFFFNTAPPGGAASD